MTRRERKALKIILVITTLFLLTSLSLDAVVLGGLAYYFYTERRGAECC